MRVYAGELRDHCTLIALFLCTQNFGETDSGKYVVQVKNPLGDATGSMSVNYEAYVLAVTRLV